MKKIVLVGGGGHCKSVIDSINSLNSFHIYGIIDIEQNIGKETCGIKVIDCDKNLYKYVSIVDYAFITIGSVGNPDLRIKLYNYVKELKFKIPTIIDRTAIVSEMARIGVGTFVGKGVIINSDSSIGDNCIVNTGAIIEHDCHIGDNVHIAPGVTLCGGVNIGSCSHVGAGSTVIQYKTLGKRTVIGAASVVVKDIGNDKKAYGNPCMEV